MWRRTRTRLAPLTKFILGNLDHHLASTSIKNTTSVRLATKHFHLVGKPKDKAKKAINRLKMLTRGLQFVL